MNNDLEPNSEFEKEDIYMHLYAFSLCLFDKGGRSGSLFDLICFVAS
jgi:hypothetical protein